MAILDVQGLTKRFCGLTAVSNLSFVVQEGKVLGIVGSNGSGKTTAFNLISGFLRPDGGRVFLDGEEITHWPPYRIVARGLARTFQVVRVFRRLTVYENIRAAKLLRVKGEAELEASIDKILRWVHLSDKRAVEAIHLPIGDLKRLEIGRALATDPRILLLDEPFSGLNHSEVGEIAALLEDLIRRGITIVIVEHVLRELKRFWRSGKSSRPAPSAGASSKCSPSGGLSWETPDCCSWMR